MLSAEAKWPLGVSVFRGETDQSGCILASEASPLLQDPVNKQSLIEK